MYINIFLYTQIGTLPFVKKEIEPVFLVPLKFVVGADQRDAVSNGLCDDEPVVRVAIGQRKSRGAVPIRELSRFGHLSPCGRSLQLEVRFVFSFSFLRPAFLFGKGVSFPPRRRYLSGEYSHNQISRFLLPLSVRLGSIE